jgi:hypothetical protein
MLVDLPAPFGPRNPRTSPFWTQNETLSTTSLGPKLFVKFSTVIMVICPKSYKFGSEDERLEKA